MHVEPVIAERLNQINHLFYQTFAVQFSDTRLRLQPGVQRVVEKGLPAGASLLDLGCGNGTLARLLGERGHRGRYVGIDFSAGLLEEARQEAAPLAEGPEQTGFRPVFLQRDLAKPGWEEDLRQAAFDRVLSFASLHHIPGEALRLAFLESARSCVGPGGQFIFSVWQFLNSPRLSERIQPWESIGLSPDAVDPGDYLMDWRRGGYGVRYVHHFSEVELDSLARRAGFRVTESFASDGKEGNLGLYQVWNVASKAV